MKRGYSSMEVEGEAGSGARERASVRKRPRPTMTVTGKRKRESTPDSSSDSEVDLKRLAITPRNVVAGCGNEPVPENCYTKQNLELRECHFLRQQRKIMGRHSEARRALDSTRTSIRTTPST